jgi:hypothetical protein
MSDIFVSYSRKDKQKAQAIAEALIEQGWSVWWDRKIPAGKTFDEIIDLELAAAKCVFVLWSKSSIASNWVKEEANEAQTRNILVPVLIEDTKIPLGFRRIQAADLINWDGNKKEVDFVVLLNGINSIVGNAIPKSTAPQIKSASQNDIPTPSYQKANTITQPNPKNIKKKEEDKKIGELATFTNEDCYPVIEKTKDGQLSGDLFISPDIITYKGNMIVKTTMNNKITIPCKDIKSIYFDKCHLYHTGNCIEINIQPKTSLQR